jgi:hypothetical protein
MERSLVVVVEELAKFNRELLATATVPPVARAEPVIELFPFAVKVVPVATVTTPPEAASEPTVSLPPTLKVPLDTITAAPSANLFAPLVFNVPPETFTFAAADVPLSKVVPLEVFTVPHPNFHSPSHHSAHKLLL